MWSLSRPARSVVFWTLAFGVGAFSGACDAASTPDDDPPSLEIGTGTWRFEPIADGAPVPLIYGAQGGWHLWVALRVRGVADDSGSLEVVHFPEAAPADASRTAHGIHLDPPNAEGARAYLGWPAILQDPACAVGGLYRLAVTFRPASGGRLTAERVVRVDPGDHPPPPCASP